MFEKIRKMKNQKGFTLVELIVVLVILAILAAMLVPALTGYIDKANNQKIVAATRQVVMAAQTEVSEAYASKTLTNGTVITITGGDAADIDPDPADTATEVSGKNIVKLAEVGKFTSDGKFDGLTNGISKIVIKYDAKGHVTEVELTQGSKVCTYKEDSSAVSGTYTSGNYGVSAKS